MDPPAPPRGGVGKDIDVPFLKVEFWLDFATGALEVMLSTVVAMVLFVIFFIVIFAVLRALRVVMSNPKRPIDPQLTKFALAFIKFVLWMQVGLRPAATP